MSWHWTQRAYLAKFQWGNLGDEGDSQLTLPPAWTTTQLRQGLPLPPASFHLLRLGAEGQVSGPDSHLTRLGVIVTDKAPSSPLG